MKIPKETYEILKNVQSPKFDDILRSSMWQGYNSYNQNYHNTGEEDVKGLEEFCKILYIDWYNSTIENYNNLQGVRKKVAETLIKYDMFASENVEKQKSNTPFYHFFLRGYDKYFKGTNTRVSSLQNGSLIQNENFNDSFLHVFGWKITGQKLKTIDARLYLNLKAKNIAKFAIEAYKKCKEKNLPFYFKFTIQDNRNDPFIFYVSFEQMPAYIKIIQQIKNENPELFEGAEVISQNLGVIDGYIGYGDEPSIKDEFNKSYSYNSIRKEVINKIRNQIKNEFKTKFKTQNNALILENPSPMTLKQYCDFQVRIFAKDNLPLNIPQGEHQRFVEAMQGQFYNAFKKMILTGQPIQDISINFGNFNATLPFSKKDWLAPFMSDGVTSTEVRGVLTKYTFFSGLKLNGDEKLLIKVVREELIKGLHKDLNDPNVKDKENVKRFLSKIDKEPAKIDKIGHGLLLLAAANFIDSGLLSIRNKNNKGFAYPEAGLTIYQHLLGEEKVEKIVSQNCSKYHISQRNICYNVETEEEMEILKEEDQANQE